MNLTNNMFSHKFRWWLEVYSLRSARVARANSPIQNLLWNALSTINARRLQWIDLKSSGQNFYRTHWTHQPGGAGLDNRIELLCSHRNWKFNKLKWCTQSHRGLTNQVQATSRSICYQRSSNGGNAGSGLRPDGLRCGQNFLKHLETWTTFPSSVIFLKAYRQQTIALISHAAPLQAIGDFLHPNIIQRFAADQNYASLHRPKTSFQGGMWKQQTPLDKKLWRKTGWGA